MAASQWYYAKGDRQLGPVTTAELKQLAGSGSLQPDDLIWREGMDDWVPAQNVRGLFGPESKRLPAAAPAPPKAASPAAEIIEPETPIGEMQSEPPQTLGVPGIGKAARAFVHPPRRADDQGRPQHLFDIAMDLLRQQFPAQLIDAAAKLFVMCGHLGLYAAMAACLVLAVILGVKADSLRAILLGAIAAMVLAVLQYVARRFCDALARLNRTTSGTMSSTAFSDCFALLSMVTGLATLLSTAVFAIQTEQYVLMLFGVVVFVVCEYLAFVALNPAVLSISVAADTRAGEEAIGVISFLLKAMLQLVPVAFGAGVVYGTLRLLFGCYQVFSKAGPAAAMETGTEATKSIMIYAALPFAAYLVFILYYLMIDVTRAILVVPGKLDKLAEKKEEQPAEEVDGG